MTTSERPVLMRHISPRNADGLRNNETRNGVDDRVSIQTRAAGNTDGVMRFDVGPGAQTGWGHLTHGSSGVEVQVVRLDTYCGNQGIDWIDVLKIDVEGADTWVLEGAQRLLEEQRVGIVFFEEDPAHLRRLGIAPGSCAAILRRASYDVHALAAQEFMATCTQKQR